MKKVMLREPFRDGYIEIFLRPRGHCWVMGFVPDPRKKQAKKPHYWTKSGWGFKCWISDYRHLTSATLDFTKYDNELREASIRIIQHALDKFYLTAAA